MTETAPAETITLGDLQALGNNCASCAYWAIDQLIDEIGPLSECRRNPPLGGLPPRYHARSARGDGSWPITWGEDWCGEFKQRPPGQPTLSPLPS
ncbi:MAG TPA: hypothetical protein VFB50_22875 [Chloroflexota bacterium]|nr:hypothetical protein [Chloroflexota bacterium]